MYSFIDEEWEILKSLYINYEKILPIFIQDYMNSFFTFHDSDRRIIDETEIDYLVSFFSYIENYNSNRPSIQKNISEDEIKDNTTEYERIKKIKQTLDELIRNINLNSNKQHDRED